MIRVVLAISALLTSGLAQKPCPETPEIKANVTNCLNLQSQMKCDGSFVTVMMTGLERGVPCEWNRRQGMCGGRLDCAFEYSNKTECGEMPKTKAPSNNCGFAGENTCEDLYSTGKMTGKTYMYPCMWSMPNDGMGSCMMNAKCGEMMKATPRPTKAPSMPPSSAPTVLPTFVPTMFPTTVPTKVPSVSPTMSPTAMPTPAPTYADICHFSVNDEFSCVAFGCHYNHDNGACTLEPFDGHHCASISSKSKCRKEQFCDWSANNKNCRAANYPTQAPTTQAPTMVPSTIGICDIFTSEFDCGAWTDLAGCHWDPVASICLEDTMTKSPTTPPSNCPGQRKKNCQNDPACDFVNGVCVDAAAPTMKPTTPTDPCFVDFSYWTLIGDTQSGVDLCNDKGVDCEVVVDPFWGHFCQPVVCSTVTNSRTCTKISHCMIQGSGRKWKCIDN